VLRYSSRSKKGKRIERERERERGIEMKTKAVEKTLVYGFISAMETML